MIISSPIAHQVQTKPCNRRAFCICAVSMRIGKLIVIAEFCSHSTLRLWSQSQVSPPGNFKIIRINSGRSYHVSIGSVSSRCMFNPIDH